VYSNSNSKPAKVTGKPALKIKAAGKKHMVIEPNINAQ